MPVDQPVKQATQIAIVTGGSRGIGRHTVMCLARRGVHSIFTHQTGEVQAHEVVALTAEAGAKAIALQLDVADSTSFADFARRVQASLAQLGVECFDTWSITQEHLQIPAFTKPKKLKWTLCLQCISKAYFY